MDASNNASPFRVIMVTIVWLFSLIYYGDLYVNASLQVFPMWNDVTIAENENESCMLSTENKKNLTKFSGLNNKMCGVQLEASADAEVMIHIPEETSIEHFLYYEKQYVLPYCQNRYAVISTINPCFFFVNLHTNARLFLQG